MAIDHPIAAKLKEIFPGQGLKASLFRGQLQIAVPSEQFLTVVTFLKNDLGYNMLSDITAVDYLNSVSPSGHDAADAGRFGVVYVFNAVQTTAHAPTLVSTLTNPAGNTAAPTPPHKIPDNGGGTNSLILRVFLGATNPAIDSLVPLYAGAEWLEREVFDMFGITFSGHPDLRRILTNDNFGYHPLRKDYPVTGKGEREAFPVVDRQSV